MGEYMVKLMLYEVKGMWYVFVFDVIDVYDII